jgi:hypothetical protein
MRVYRNLMITMVLGGLWHGASWTFVVWGFLHGLLLIAHRILLNFCSHRQGLDAALQTVPGTALRRAATFSTVALCWVFFRATTFGDALAVLRGLAVPRAGLGAPLSSMSLWYTLAFVALCHAAAQTGWWKKVQGRLPAPVFGIAYGLVLTAAFILAPGESKTFIYFQF